MQLDFHYYATYCAAYLAGYSHGECLSIAYSDQFVDCCTGTLLSRINAPVSAATTQSALEMADAPTDPLGLQDITRIWSSFHFLPYDLYAQKAKRSKRYLNKYRLICNTNGPLVADTVLLAKGKGLQAAGIAMHVLADTWAHRYFAGTPSLVINNTDYHFYEQVPSENGTRDRQVMFRHSLSKPDDLQEGIYTNSMYRSNENSIMNLGHGRAGHLPDYSFMRYRYQPAWGEFEEIEKDNPHDFYLAFAQMIYALKFLRGQTESFQTDTYDTLAFAPWEDRIRQILEKRQLDSSDDWKAFGEMLSGTEIEPFEMEKYEAAYLNAPDSEKDDTFLGRFILAALAQKSMVTAKIYQSGSLLAGFSVDFHEKGFRGIRDFRKLVDEWRRGGGI